MTRGTVATGGTTASDGGTTAGGGATTAGGTPAGGVTATGGATGAREAIMTFATTLGECQRRRCSIVPAGCGSVQPEARGCRQARPGRAGNGRRVAGCSGRPGRGGAASGKEGAQERPLPATLPGTWWSSAPAGRARTHRRRVWASAARGARRPAATCLRGACPAAAPEPPGDPARGAPLDRPGSRVGRGRRSRQGKRRGHRLRHLRGPQAVRGAARRAGVADGGGSGGARALRPPSKVGAGPEGAPPPAPTPVAPAGR